MFTITRIVIVLLKTTEVEKSIISLASYHPIRQQNERICVSVNISPFFYIFFGTDYNNFKDNLSRLFAIKNLVQ